MRIVLCTLLFSLLAFSSFAFDFKVREMVDLNGDGTPEDVTISGITEEGNFTLRVGGVSVRGKLEMGESDGFVIVDIDTSDRYKEIAVHTSGPSDDDEYIIYWYDGRSIKEVGRLSRWPVFPGNGIVYVDDWMGFWKKRDKYVLDKNTRKLRLVPQELYYVGVEARVNKSFPIYKTRDRNEILANLKPNSKIIILACYLYSGAPSIQRSPDDYLKDWYLIKSETGLLGWTTFKVLLDNLEGLPFAD